MFKKISLIILVFFTLMIVGNAATTDTTPPVVNSFKINKTTYKQGDKPDITVDATDDISGVDSVHISFQSDGYEYITLVIMNWDTKKNITKIDSSAKPGTYYLMSYRIYDKAGNSICHASNKNQTAEDCVKDLDATAITILENDSVSKPTVSNIKINKKTFNVGEKIEVSATITSSSNIKTATAIFEDIEAITLKRVGNTNTFKGSTTAIAPGSIKFNTLSVLDEEENWWKFAYVEKKDIFTDCICSIPNNSLNATITGEKDTIMPRLKSVKILKKEITAPGVNTIEVEATDNVGIKRVQVDFSKKNGKIVVIGGDWTYKNGKYTTTVSVDQYADIGEYYIERIYITDTSNNTVSYSVNEDVEGDLPLERYSFKIVKDKETDKVTTTIDDTAADIINNAKDDAIIAVDSTRNSIVKKELFEAIKGTNKTLYIETEGILWIFYGKDITNEVKDIDVKVDIYQNVDIGIINENSLVINFASNGILPGPAKVKIKAEYTLRHIVGEKDLYVYYYDETKGILDPVVEKLELSEDGYYEFYITHNSKYVITSKLPNKKYISSKKDILEINNSINSDNYNIKLDGKNIVNIDNYVESGNQLKINSSTGSNIFAIIGALIVIVPLGGGISYMIYKKHKKGKKIKLESNQ